MKLNCNKTNQGLTQLKIFDKEDLCIACHEFRLKGQFLDSFSHWPKNTFHYFDDISQVLLCPLLNTLPPSHVAVYFLIDWVCTYLGQYRVTTNSLDSRYPELIYWSSYFLFFSDPLLDMKVTTATAAIINKTPTQLAIPTAMFDNFPPSLTPT